MYTPRNIVSTRTALKHAPAPQASGCPSAFARAADNELSVKCMNVLMNSVGPVDAERFISIVTNAAFDYTDWQKNLFEGDTLDTLFEKVKSFQPETELRGQSV